MKFRLEIAGEKRGLAFAYHDRTKEQLEKGPRIRALLCQGTERAPIGVFHIRTGVHKNLEGRGMIILGPTVQVFEFKDIMAQVLSRRR